MRIALWFLGLFGVAVALALFASGNQGSITVFWPPYRIDLSVNMVVVALTVFFVLVHLALNALSALLSMPGQARSWRIRHQERVMYSAFLDALSHLIAGRFIRAKKASELVLAREAAIARSGETWADAARMRVLSHLLAAQCAHSLQDRAGREAHFQKALSQATQFDAGGSRDGVLLRAVRWALHDRDAAAAQSWLEQLPSGVARRTVALRLRLKVARLAGKTESALDTVRLLAKHKAFSEVSAHGLVRALVLEYLHTAREPEQLQTIWGELESPEREVPEVAIAAAGILVQLGGDVSLAFDWLLPLWTRMVESPEGLTAAQKVALIRVIERGFSAAEDSIDTVWLTRIEQAQQAYPAEAGLQYLAGVACLHLKLWGKSQQLMKQALPRLQDPDLLANAWRVLAELAQRQGDDAQAAHAWKQASQNMRPLQS